MSEATGEEVVAIGEGLVNPAGSMSNPMMEAAERIEVCGAGRPAVSPLAAAELKERE